MINKITDKDKQDWEKFLKDKKKIPNKDFPIKRNIRHEKIKTHKKVEGSLEVIVDFVSEIITCIKDKDKKIISGDAEKIKTVYDTWVFSKDVKSPNPNWLLIDTIT